MTLAPGVILRSLRIASPLSMVPALTRAISLIVFFLRVRKRRISLTRSIPAIFFNSPKFNVFQREQIVMRVARRRNPGVGRFIQFLGKTDKMGGLPCSPQANKRRGVLGKDLSTSRWKRRDELLWVRD